MTRYGSDAIVELLVEAGIEQVALNPGASFRGIHDSLVQRDDAPKLVLCLHEAIAVAVAQGYAKAAGKPMAVLLHDVVGLQNASMAIYNAWCDRVPMLLLGGTGPKSKAARRPWIDWIHTATVQANIVRDFVKWDDEPHDLASIPESFARALTTTRSAPCGPVYLCYDADLQEADLPADVVAHGIAGYPIPSAPAAANAELEWLLDRLRGAHRPAILAGHVGDSPQAFAALVQFAEALGAPVLDTGVRHAFPTNHPLAARCIPELLDEADVVLALDVEDLQSPLGARLGPGGDPDVHLLNVSLSSLRLRSWAHDYQSLLPAERHVTADADLVVAALLSELRASPLDAEVIQARTAAVTERTRAMRANLSRAAAAAEADGAVPLDRLIHELGLALEGERYILASGTNQRLEHCHLSLDGPRQYLGWHGGGGLGYGVGASIGAALANGPQTISVDVQADGDLLFLPSALWTASHLQLPLLIVVHNNRQYGNTVEHACSVARHRGRDPGRRHVGAGLGDPPVDLAGLAASFRVWSAGPITDAARLAERLQEAVSVVRSGRPALLDVLTPAQ